MSSNIATEVRRISDARSRLKSIIDQQAQAQAAQLSPDDFKFQTNATIVQSDKGYVDDVTIDSQCSQTASALQMPLSPIEPDLATLNVWMSFGNLGNQDDLALMGNSGRTRGNCSLVAGPTGTGNLLIGGTRAILFDGYTSFLDVADNAEIRMPAAGGFSFCIRINVTSFTQQIDNATKLRTIAAKTDDASNAWELVLSTAGDLLFHVKRAGTEYKVKSTGLSSNTWYDIVVTYAVTGNIATIYRNNVGSTTADVTASQYPASTDLNLHIGHANSNVVAGNEYGRGASFDALSFDALSFDTTDFLDPPTNSIPHSVIDGGFNGALQAPRLYNVVLTSTQVGYLYTNKLSISNIGLGAVAIAGYCISHS